MTGEIGEHCLGSGEGRYTHRVVISNSRLVSLDERGVTFRYKDCRRQGPRRRPPFRTAAFLPVSAGRPRADGDGNAPGRSLDNSGQKLDRRKVKSRVIKFCHSKGMAEEGEHDDIPTASEAAHYRGLAHSLRELARQCRIARARLELVQLAVKLEQRAERLEQGRR